MLMGNSHGVLCKAAEAMSTDTARLLILNDSVSLFKLVNCGTYRGTVNAERGTTAKRN